MSQLLVGHVNLVALLEVISFAACGRDAQLARVERSFLHDELVGLLSRLGL